MYILWNFTWLSHRTFVGHVASGVRHELVERQVGHRGPLPYNHKMESLVQLHRVRTLSL